MKKTYLIWIIWCSLLLSSWHAKASHLAGAEIEYTCLGLGSYEVTLVLYADCGGISQPSTASITATENGCSNSNFNATLSLISTTEVPLYCDAALSTCNGGSLFGVRKLIYKSTINFPVSSTCSWRLSYTNCCRNGNTANIQSPASNSMYTESFITNVNDCNSSPTFTNNPIFLGCVNQQYTVSHSTIESNGDSIVYELAQPLNASTSPIAYNAGYNVSNPIFSTGGVNFSATTGQLDCYPSNSEGAAFDIVVKEYRNGTLVGSIRRATQMTTTFCSSNFSFELQDVSRLTGGVATSQGTFTVFDVCPGDSLTFEATFTDPNAMDSLSYELAISSLEQLYPSALVVVNYPNAPISYDTVVLLVSIPATLNANFSIGLTDNACPAQSQQSFGFYTRPDSTCVQIAGRIAIDGNANCLVEAIETPYQQALVRIEKPGFVAYASPDANGYYQMVVDAGIYTVSVSTFHPYWVACTPSATTSGVDTILDFSIESLGSCPLMYVNIGAPRLISCLSNYYAVDYCNHGTDTAYGSYIEVTLDSLFLVDSATIPIASQSGFTYTFNLGTVGIGDCANFRIYGTLDTLCDTTNLGATYCAMARIYPDSICFPDTLWSGANLEVEANCDADSVAFRINNTGLSAMPNTQTLWVIEDNVIFHSEPFNLNGGGNTPWYKYYANGSTYRVQADQVEHHPWQSKIAAVVEGCLASTSANATITTGLVNTLPLNDDAPWVSIDCQVALNSWDPNEKVAFPEGYGADHFIEKNTNLEYRIRFQNTGTAPALDVVILDTLSEYLDPASIQFGAYSHAYTWRVLDNAVLEFTFANINLIDSNANEPMSHGFVDYKISQQSNIPLGTVINNTAAIYFDLNPAVITNTTFHTIGENFVQIQVTTNRNEWNQNEAPRVKIYPNPFSSTATFQILGDQEYQQIDLTVYDLTGKEVQQIRVNNQQQLQLPKGNLTQGVYFFKLQGDGAVIESGKLIVK